MADDQPRFEPAEDTSETLYVQLRRIAGARFDRLPASEAAGATDLLHETWAKLAARDWNDRHHFVSTFARAAQQILIDVARKSARRQAGIGRPRVLDEDLTAASWQDPVGHPEAYLRLADAIEDLRAESPEAADFLLTHLLLDVPVETIAASTHPRKSVRTVQRTLKTARLWVHRRLADAVDGGET